MDKGEIRQIGTPEELLFHPANDFVAGFLDEQRLQLELKSVLLNEVLPGYPVGGSVTVWDQMGLMLHPGKVRPGDETGLNHKEDPEEIRSDHNDKSTIPSLSIGELMQAFAAYKKR